MHPTEQKNPAITAVILAAGGGRRMGGEDKGLLLLNGRPLIAHVLERLAPQCDEILLNIHRNQSAYAAFGYPLIGDTLTGGLGPLAGILSALEQCQSEYLLSIPCDTPNLPNDLAQRLLTSLQQQQTDICTVDDGERLHPVIMLLHSRLRDDLREYLLSGGRKVREWLQRHSHCVADFHGQAAAFTNINTPQELLAQQREAPR